jgi:hypothetical protein
MPGGNGAKGGKYLYVIMAGSGERTYGPIGIDGSNVYAISGGEVAAIVSDLNVERMRPERRNLTAHRDVINKLMQHSTVLPMSFGIIGQSRRAIHDFLLTNQEALVAQLRRVAGRVEMGLRVTWDVPNIFEYFVSTHPELRAARDRLMSGRGEPTHEQKIELGRQFDHILNEDRESHTRNVENVLSNHCVEITRNECRKVTGVMNLACLINREDQGAFEVEVLKAAELFDNNYSFDYNGPWAPHNFVDVDLKL